MKPVFSTVEEMLKAYHQCERDASRALNSCGPRMRNMAIDRARFIGVMICNVRRSIMEESNTFKRWAQHNRNKAQSQNEKAHLRRVRSLRNFKQLIGRVVRIKADQRISIDEARQGSRRRVTGAPVDFEGRPFLFSDLIGAGLLDAPKPKTAEEILEDLKRAGDALNRRWPAEQFASACLVDDIGREIPTFAFGAGSPSESYTVESVPLLDGSPALDMVAVMRAYECVDHKALVHGTSNWCAAMASALRDVLRGK